MLYVNCEGPIFDVPDDKDSIPPVLTITFPADQSILSDSVLISAYAFDNIELDSVTLYLNDSIVHSSKEGPFEHHWSTFDNTEDEFHTIRAKAVDISGNVNYTNTIRVLVDNLDNINPIGSLIFPYTGQTVTGNVNILVEANDNEGIASVSIFIDGELGGSIEEPPYSYDWNTFEEVDDVIHTIHAHVRDNAGNQITLGPINVTIDNYETDDNTAPTGTILEPANGSSVSGEFIDIIVNAYDNLKMGSVDFLINGNLMHSDNSGSNEDNITGEIYSYSWDIQNETEDNDHTINIVVIDSAGNATSLYPISVLVDRISNDITPPTIIIQEPVANQSVSDEVIFIAITNDNYGNIEKVEFYHDYILVGEGIATLGENIGEYTYSWDTNFIEDDTEHLWYAMAYDTSDNASQTQPMLLIVNNVDNEPPTGSIQNPISGQIVSDSVNIIISAYDNNGIDQVESFLNGFSLSIDDEPPYEYLWNTNEATEDYEHVIYAIITDIDGNTATLPSISVVVNNDDTPENDTTHPIVNILNPVATQVVSDTVNILGFATDNHDIYQVKFYVDDQLITTVYDSPYVALWNTHDFNNFSEHVIQMSAEDPSGNLSNAQPVLVTIFNGFLGEINDLALTASENIISINWSAVTEAESYKIYKDGIFLIESLALSYDDIVEPGIQYCYSISAVNGENIEGPLSPESCETALYPQAPTLSLEIAESIASLNWTSISTAASYRVYEDNVFLIEVEEISYDIDIGTGVNTCFKVTAINEYGTESPFSNEECGEGT